ncbi:hypothetical protein LTR86_005426 [Recurvomyces mirabilis]|nr:hypothetical protein LTR86_005426 [Recurvomyces mirabilis]
MAPSRFTPEPSETSTKSSKDVRQPLPEKDEITKPRRFAVEPVETSATSSKDPKAEPVKSEPRRFAVEPVETEHKSSKDRGQSDSKPQPRRFAVEPVETEHKSSKDRKASSEQSKPRRFAPQVEEITSRSSKEEKTEHGKPHIKFLPQPVETIYRTRRKSPADEDDVLPKDVGNQRTVRKFAPILIDTASRSRRAGDDGSGLDQSEKTESGHHLHAQEHRRHIRGDKTPADESEDGMELDGPHCLDIPQELRRELAPLDGSAPARRPSVVSTRSHSFRCPELDTIESSESERGSIMSSLSSSPDKGSPITVSDSSFTNGVGGHKHATRKRESVDESFTHYLRQLEAQKAQQRLLRELAADAFPNSDYHEPVQHYMDIDEGSDEMEIEDRPVTYDFEDELLLEMAARRESTAKVNWEQMEMQRHAEQLEQERNAAKSTKKRTEQMTQSPWWNPAQNYGLEKQDEEMRSMRDRARPPMLGNDLVFPRCPSPEPARFDVTQGSTVLRNQMCYLTEHADSQVKDEDEGGLWSAPPEREVTITSAAGSSKGSQDPKRGLWGGFCIRDDSAEHAPPNGLAPHSAFAAPTGLLTPMANEGGYNPFEQSFAVPAPALSPGLGIQTPPTPPRGFGSSANLNRLDGMLNTEQLLDATMEKEYPNSFITQIYNYLSLGYPALARPFDEELSKISRIPIKQLREDDRKAKSLPRGYIRLGPDFEGGGGEGVEEESCVRWQALRLYVREWARQEKDMVPTDQRASQWGTGARRGSWAI